MSNDRFGYISSEGGGWEGFYIDGELVNEGHNLDWWKILDILCPDIECDIIEGSEEDFNKWGYKCPPEFPEGDNK